jgi:nucleoside-diphosphate-sugar epimerase
MKRVLLTGASGTVGREVLRQLCESPRQYDVTVFDKKTRPSIAAFRKYRDRISVIYGDISDKNDLSEACSNKEVIIHLAAIIPPLADKNPSLANSVNITGTKNLIESVEEKSPEAFFLYSSSISVYGDRLKNPWIRVTDPLIPSDRDEYAKTKIAAENLVRNSRLKWSIFRLTAIMGINNHKISELMFHMPLESCMEIATPGDTGRAFVNALNHLPELNGNIYNLSGGENCRITYSDFLKRSFEIFGLGRLNFSENTFAGRNFHCGYYADGDILNDLLDFRRDTIDDYFKGIEKSVPPLRKFLTIPFRSLIKKNLQKRSEPFTAVKAGNEEDIKHFF